MEAGFVGNVEYIEKNMFGLGQKLVSRMEFGQVDKLFKVKPAIRDSISIDIELKV